MTIKEKEEYKRKNTGICAFKLRKKLDKKRQNMDMVVFSDGSVIFYKYNGKMLEEDNLLDSIEITEARGRVEGKSIEELKNIVYNSHISMAEAIINNYENAEEFLDKYNKNKSIELSLDKKEEYSNIDEIEKSSHKKRVRKK